MLGAFAISAPAWGVAQTIVASNDFYTAATYTMDQGDRPSFQNTGSITVKLSTAGKAKLADRNSAKVTVTCTVPFGSPDSAKKTLH